MQSKIRNISVFTVDLEDWYSSATMHFGPDFDFAKCESRIEIGTLKILDMLDKKAIKATFFVLGFVAERTPEIVREIQARGHEIASHGYSHKLITSMTPGEFRDDISRSIDIISYITGEKVRGYRAPAFTIVEKTLWAYDVLASLGIEFDSSVYPISIHPNYGMAEASLVPYRTPSGIIELPLSCAEYLGKRIPCSGGGYFRLYPYPIFKHLVSKVHEQKRPYIFYIHPWELDHGQPKLDYSPTAKFRQYNHLKDTQGRLAHLLDDFEFSPLSELLSI